MNLNGTFRKGHKVPQSWRDKISRARKDIIFSEKHIENLSKSHKGKKIPREQVDRQRTSIIKTWDIRGRKSKRLTGNNMEYKQWRRGNFLRDDYTCQLCRERGIRLHVHHIKNWVEYPRLRFNLNNGITLCEECHRKIHNRKIREEAIDVLREQFPIKTLLSFPQRSLALEGIKS